MSGDDASGSGRKVRLTPPPRVEPVAKRGVRPRSAATPPPSAPVVSGSGPSRLLLLLVPLALVVVTGLFWILARESGPEPKESAVELSSPAAVPTASAAGPVAKPVEEVEARRPRGGAVEVASRGVAVPEPAEPASPMDAVEPTMPLREPNPTAHGSSTPDPEFGRAMADGLAALENGDWPRARGAFEAAATLDPGSGEPAAGLARVAAAEGRQQIEQHRVRALDDIEAEAWRPAAAEYQAALAIDPTLSFARAGLEKAERRAELSEQLDFHLGNPGRLSAPAVLAEVEDLLERAREIERPGPRHVEQMAKLKEMTADAQTTVAVSLRSDGLTEVTVYRVGRLGTFERRELQLRPGTYTVVGSRSGYRDVRRQLEVEVGKQPEPLEVRCEERV